MPVLQYFLVVGSVLTGLLFYTNSVMAPAALPFSVSQRLGFPEPYKAPVVVVEVPKPVIIAATVKSPVESKKPLKEVRKHKPTRVVHQSVSQGRYAAYPPREFGSIW